MLEGTVGVGLIQSLTLSKASFHTRSLFLYSAYNKNIFSVLNGAGTSA